MWLNVQNNNKKDLAMFGKLNKHYSIAICVSIVFTIFAIFIESSSNDLVNDTINIIPAFATENPLFNLLSCTMPALSFFAILFIAGCVVANTKNTASWYFKKSLIFAGLAFFIQILKSLNYTILIQIITNDAITLASFYEVLLGNFILVIALCFAITGILKLLKFKSITIAAIMLLIGIVLNLISTTIEITLSKNLILDLFLGYFVISDLQCNFPFFNWFIVFALGFVFHTIYLKLKNKNKFWITLVALSLIATIVYVAVSLNSTQEISQIFNNTDGVFSHIVIWDAFGSCFIVTLLICLCHFIERFFNKTVIKISNDFANSYVFIYGASFIVAQLVCTLRIMFNGASIEYSILDSWIFLIIVLLVCILLSVFYTKFIKQKITPFFRKYSVFISIGMIVLSIIIFVIAINVNPYYAYFGLGYVA